MTPPQDLRGLIKIFIDIINPLLLVIAGASLLAFLWGLTIFIFQSGDTKAHERGKSIMVWGLVGLFVMVSLWGILSFLYGNFFTGTLGFPLLPGGIKK